MDMGASISFLLDRVGSIIYLNTCRFIIFFALFFALGRLKIKNLHIDIFRIKDHLHFLKLEVC